MNHNNSLSFFLSFFFFLYGGKVHHLARVTKNLHVIFLRPLFRPHDTPSPLPRGRSHVTEPDLYSPWEGPKSGSYCTHALGSLVGFLLYSRFFLRSHMQYIQLGSLGRLYMQYTQLGNLPLRDKGSPGPILNFLPRLAKKQ